MRRLVWSLTSLLPACTESGLVLSRAESEPAPVTESQVSAGRTHTCALTDGVASCWGANQAAQLGSGDGENRNRPQPVATPTRFARISAGTAHTCAISEARDVYCWGENRRGELGTGTRLPEPIPRRVGLELAIANLSCDYEHCCALSDAGELWCWGKNDEGELGQGDTYPDGAPEDADALSPRRVGDITWRAVDTGQGHTCAIQSDGTLWCWGRNSDQQLGSDPRIQVRIPIQIGVDDDWLAVHAGQSHSCARKRDGSLWCWGRNTGLTTEEGFPLGVGGELVAQPSRVALPAAVASFDTDTFHSCAVLRNSDLWCWGRNVEGQLGFAEPNLLSIPTRVGTGFTEVDVGRFSTCAIQPGGAVLCSGINEHGELGTGDFVNRFELTPIAR